MTTPRRAAAAIQQARPAAFSRLLRADAPHVDEAAFASVDEFLKAAASREGMWKQVMIEGVRLGVSASPVMRSETRPLAGQVALVSGAASGIGLGIARGLHGSGACVAFADTDEPALKAIASELGDPDRVLPVKCNVTDEASVAAACDAVLARWGRLDGLACCAGTAPSYALEDFPLDKWRHTLEVNLTGYFLCGREAARIMKAQKHGGWMVLLSSKTGLDPSKANSAYNATKAGELHLARGWALELGHDHIRVNCIAPGNVFEGSSLWTPEYIAKIAQKRGIQPDQVIPHYIGMTALRRDIKLDDIAHTAVFLASDASRCITGQVIVVDSGTVWTR